MLMTLIKKQYYECFRNYFVNSKTGKAKSKISIIGMFVLFAFLMIFLGLIFVGMAYSVVDILQTNFSWLYYALFGLITIALGTFASVFSTSSAMYNAKDNDLLLSLPIKPSTILLSRVSLVYGLSLLYSTFVWIPICVFGQIITGFSVIVFVMQVLLLFIISAFTSVVSCIIGFIIALVTSKVKKKSLVTTVSSLIFLAVYYFVCFRFETFLNTLIENGKQVADFIYIWGKYIFQLAMAAQGDLVGFVIFTVVTSALAGTCYYILSKSFSKLTLSSGNVKTTNNKVVYQSKSSVSKSLLMKELKRFASSPTYLLNCGIGIIFILAAGIMIVVKKADIAEMLVILQDNYANVITLIPLLIIGIICFMSNICFVAAPSISLEGRSLWILKSLPIDTYKILDAKKTLQLLVNGIPSIISGILMAYAFKLEYFSTFCILICIYLYTEIFANISVLVSLINPNFNWTSEMQPIKQSIYVLLDMVIGMILVVIFVGAYFLLHNTVSISDYIEYLIIGLAICTILTRRLVRGWGVKKFESL